MRMRPASSVSLCAAGLCVLLGFGVFFTVSPARAQEANSPLAARFQLADAYLRAGQYERAIALLEDLHEAHPETYAFYNRLLQAYESVKRYDDAIALIEDRLMQGVEDAAVLLSEKARLLYLQGDEAAAAAAWQQAAAQDPQASSTHHVVYQSMLELRLFDQAIAVLEAGRAALEDSLAYQTELAYLYNLDGQHTRAMQEYLGLLRDDERRLSFVRSRLSRFIEQKGALRESIAEAERGVREQPLNRAYREILAWLYMEAEMYREALDANRAIDRLEREEGRVLFSFAHGAADAQAYEVALEAFEEILARYPDSPVAPETQFGLAETHARWAEQQRERAVDERGRRAEAPHYEAALQAYQAFLEAHPAHPAAPEVLRRVGLLQQDVFFDLTAAETTFARILREHPDDEPADHARYDLGRIELLRGNLDGARLRLSRLVDRLRLGELAEQARYDLALLHFYEGAFKSALTLASAIDENTSTDVANDAIALKVLLLENTGPDSLDAPLRLYAQARLHERQREPEAALHLADSLLQAHGQHPLADEARFLRAQTLRATGETEAALAAFEELPLIHPTSPLADRSLFQAAEIYEREFGDERAAQKAYTRVLTDYPGSLLIPEVRTRIRALRGDGA